MAERLVAHARASIERQGTSARGLTADEIFGRAMHGTTDAALARRRQSDSEPAHAAAASPLKVIARQTVAPDFRSMLRFKLSDILRQWICYENLLLCVAVAVELICYKSIAYGGIATRPLRGAICNHSFSRHFQLLKATATRLILLDCITNCLTIASYPNLFNSLAGWFPKGVSNPCVAVLFAADSDLIFQGDE